jgi:predicted DNA-binding transcriptional regulator YafY
MRHLLSHRWNILYSQDELNAYDLGGPVPTEMPRGERIATILLLLIRRRGKKFSIEEIMNYLNQQEPVILRNVQRDCKTLAEKNSDVIGVERRDGKLYYFVQPDMRDKLSLPIERNGLLAFFLLKRLQPFFTQEARSITQLSEAVAELGSSDDYELFEDLDERLSESTYLFGDQSAFSLDGSLFNNLLTALSRRRKLDITYRQSEGKDPVNRTICPAKLILFKGELYFICISELHDDRNYYIKLCRIITATLRPDQFTIPPKRMDRINKRLTTSFGILDADEPKPEEIILRFPGYFDLLLSERRFHNSQKLSTDKAGNVIVQLRAPVDRDLIQWVLGWSDRVEVVKPVSLKKRLYALGQMLVVQNKTGKNSSTY